MFIDVESADFENVTAVCMQTEFCDLLRPDYKPASGKPFR
jgi:hypothetical protein